MPEGCTKQPVNPTIIDNTVSKVVYESRTGNLTSHENHFRLAPLGLVRDGWFHHPADAHYLSSIVSHTDPCELHGRAHHMLNQTIRITILNRYVALSPPCVHCTSTHTTLILTHIYVALLCGRRSDRRLINYDKLGAVVKRVNAILSLAQAGHPPLVFTQKSILSSTTDEISSSSSSSGVTSKDSTPYSFDFEGNTFREQVSIMRATDILLTVHGAAETNIAWMHPCSVVLEVSV